MAERVFAGYRYAERLHTCFYGQVFGGASLSDGRVAWVLRVDRGLSQLPAFSSAVARLAPAYKLLRHENLVGVRAAGVDSDGTVVVVSDALPDSVTLQAILEREGGALDMPIAAAVATSAMAGLAYLHGAGLQHGAVHPQSIRVDVFGQVRLADSLVGRALAEAGASDANRFLELGRFVAPELRRGQPLSAPSDVFALSMVVSALASYPGPVESILSTAESTSPMGRPADGAALFGRFRRALADAAVELASPTEVGRSALGADVVDSVDAATDGLVAELMGDKHKPGSSSSFAKLESSVPRGMRSSAQPVAALDEALESLSRSVTPRPDSSSLPLAPAELDEDEPAPRRFPRLGPSEPPVPLESEESTAIQDARKRARQRLSRGDAVEPHETGEVTKVDDVDALLMHTDPISEIIKLGPLASDEPDGLDEVPTEAVSKRSISARLPVRDLAASAAAASDALRSLDDRDVAASAAAASDALSSLGETGELDSFAGLDRLASPLPSMGPGAAASPTADMQARREPPQRAPTPLPRPRSEPVAFKVKSAAGPFPAIPDPIEGFEDTSNIRRKSSGLWWMIAATLTVGSSFGYVYTQTDLFHPERAQAKRDRAKREAEAEAERLRALQAKPGTMTVDASEEDAAVWMLLGRTPLSTFTLPASAITDLRFELDGHRPVDLAVTGPMWTGEGSSLAAAIHARLEAGEATEELPAFPKAPEQEPPPGPEGQGHIRVESSPTGAKVWLLVGFTPEVAVSGIEAGKTYQFRVLKDGFEPATVTFDEREWYLSGEAGVGKVKPNLAKKAELKAKAPKPKDAPEKPKR